MKKEAFKKGAWVMGKIILGTLAVGGIVITGAIAPNLFTALRGFRALSAVMKDEDDEGKLNKRITNSFYYLARKGYIRMRFQGKQLYISLTPEGRKKATKCQLDSLVVERTQTWDGRWRMVLFDVQEKQKIVREALRGKLKELGFFQVQKSVWIHAFPCERQLMELKEFFGLHEEQFLCFELKSLPQRVQENAQMFFQVNRSSI